MVEAKTLEGRTVTFRSEPGKGPTLVCVHASAENHHAYDRLLDALPGRRTIAINLPGRAGTDGPPLQTATEMARFVATLIESEVDGDFVIVGHSLGGAVALELALMAPDRLRGLILLATGARLRVHPLILQLFEQIEDSGVLPPTPPGLYQADTDPALIERAAEHRRLTPSSAGRADWHAADTFDRIGQLERIHAPALIVAGSEDLLTPPKYAEYLATHIRDSELHVLEGAGHMFVIERAGEIAPLIESFVARIGGD